jgi:3-hydroxybutyryl-CoA dehydrogenase
VRIDLVGVVGLGTMGAGIAEVLARAGVRVVAVEVTDELVASGRGRVLASLQRAVDRGRLDEAERVSLLERVTFTADRSALAAADLVVEAVPERLDIKAALFDDLDRICGPATILATNTSSLPVTQIAAATGRPGRVVGMHFFNPAPVMRLVEVVHTVLTDDDVIEAVRELANSAGKTPVVVGDRAGFVANALLFGYLNQAARMAETRHASIDDIDRAMSAACGLPMGPLTLMDLIGLDVCLEVLEVMYAETRDQRYAAAPLLRRLVMARHLGRKTRRGYYSYGDHDPVPVAVPAPDLPSSDVAPDVTASDAADLDIHVPAAPRQGVVVELVARTPAAWSAVERRRSELEAGDHVAVVCKDRPGRLVEALLYPHLNDAVRMVDEGYASREDVDVAMRLGCGYPQGPFAMLAAIGAHTVAERLPAIAATMPSAATVASPLLLELGDL